MGIAGLLPLLKSIQKPVNLRDYSGKTFAVDAYSWLHKGAFFCALDLCSDKYTLKFVEYSISRIKMMRHFGVEPFLVFDGCPLPSKRNTDEERSKKREFLKNKGKNFLKQGLLLKAEECFQSCVDVTPSMALELIKILRRLNVKYLVAPYEADSQMAYLEKIGLVSGVITEDSDLLVFGCKRVLYKLSNNGDAIEITIDSLSCNQSLNFSNWNFDSFRKICILSGCDYLSNINGIGLKTAYKELKKHGSVERMLTHLELQKPGRIPHDYLKRFKQAELTFLHQQVFDPLKKEITNLNSPLADENLEFLGTLETNETTLGIVSGEICPLTLTRLFDFSSNVSSRENDTTSKNIKAKDPLTSSFVANRITMNPKLISSSNVPLLDHSYYSKFHSKSTVSSATTQIGSKPTKVQRSMYFYLGNKQKNKENTSTSSTSFSASKQSTNLNSTAEERITSKYFSQEAKKRNEVPNLIFSESSQILKKQKRN